MFAVTRTVNWLLWLAVILGVWLVITPWVLQFTADARLLWNNIIVGIVVVLIALYTWYTGTRAKKA